MVLFLLKHFEKSRSHLLERMNLFSLIAFVVWNVPDET